VISTLIEPEPSVDSQINEQSVLETSNNVEINTFVSKSNDEEEKNIEKVGEDIHLPSIGSSSSPKSESAIKEIPQHQTEINSTPSQPEITKGKMMMITEYSNQLFFFCFYSK
jgi:hypothetical protein